jgi:tRNA uracil 4-sulfurtransferase
MKYDGIIVKFGELFLKGKNRFRFIDRVLATMKNKLIEFEEELTYFKTNDHINISLNGVKPEAVIEKLNFVFGLERYQLYTHCATEMQAIMDTTLAVIKEIENDDKSIKIFVKRGFKRFPLQSPQMAQKLGIFIADNSTIKVDLDKPDLKVKVLIREEQSFVVSKEVLALGGLPIGLNGKSTLMLSGGLDSPVAAYLMMKRGLMVEGLHFDSPPYTSPRARQKVLDLAEKLAHYMPNGKFVVWMVPFTKLQKEIFAHIPDSYGMTVMRRMMYRIAEGVANYTKSSLLSNGESIGQVASQTPQSMLAINSVITIPNIRPVACMDKVEIMDIARKIDTYDISIRPYEDCCTVFLPKNPATTPTAAKCEKYELKFDWAPFVDECISNIEKVIVEAGKPILVDEETSDEICALL